MHHFLVLRIPPMEALLLHHLDICSPLSMVVALSFLLTVENHVELCHCSHLHHRYLPMHPKGVHWLSNGAKIEEMSLVAI
jgi:hypothetical protein